MGRESAPILSRSLVAHRLHNHQSDLICFHLHAPPLLSHCLFTTVPVFRRRLTTLTTLTYPFPGLPSLPATPLVFLSLSSTISPERIIQEESREVEEGRLKRGETDAQTSLSHAACRNPFNHAGTHPNLPFPFLPSCTLSHS